MAPKPKNSEDFNYSSLGMNPIPSRKMTIKSSEQWIEDKKSMDGAEGLWRVYDGIYDLSDFVKKHPGGSYWLEATKGLDVTEAFESHHISTIPEETLKKYYVRQARTPRNSPYTFHENGFYKTLKRNVREALKDVPKNYRWKSHAITDSLVVACFLFAILACRLWSYPLAILSGILLGATSIASHNYYHQRDNFRMYYSDIFMGSSSYLRMLHIISHHMYTNSVSDFQAYAAEPFAQYFPHKKSFVAKYVSWLYVPLLFWSAMFFYLFSLRMVSWIVLGKNRDISKADLLPWILPLSMYFLSDQSLLAVVGLWMLMIAISGFWFNFIGNSTTHYHPDIFIDGDTPREDLDWGISQLDTVSDRHESCANLLFVLTTFGNHAMHHLFPAFDHALHPYIHPVIQETMKEFNVDIRMTTQMDMWGGYFRQLTKEEPNPNPPNLFVNKDRSKRDSEGSQARRNSISISRKKMLYFS